MADKREHLCYAADRETGLIVRIFRESVVDTIELSDGTTKQVLKGMRLITDGGQAALSEDGNVFTVHGLFGPRTLVRH